MARNSVQGYVKMSYARGSGDGGFATPEELFEQGIYVDGLEHKLARSIRDKWIDGGLEETQATVNVALRTAEVYCKQLVKFAKGEAPLVYPDFLSEEIKKLIVETGNRFIE